MIFIEKMQKKDSEDVFFLQKKCFSISWSRSSLEDMFLVEGYHNFVAREQGILLGYIGMKAVCDEADITNVAVDPTYRRRGIARALFGACFAAGELDFLTLEVRPSNAAALALYRELGFQPVGRRRDFYTDPTEDALLLTKTFKKEEPDG